MKKHLILCIKISVTSNDWNTVMHNTPLYLTDNYTYRISEGFICLTQLKIHVWHGKKISPTQVHKKQTPLLHLTNYLLVDKRALLPYKLVKNRPISMAFFLLLHIDLCNSDGRNITRNAVGTNIYIYTRTCV
jgi:hypothetical protein